MKAATVNEIKQELQQVEPKVLVDLCLRLAKYKKDNKELLTYLLFEAHDQASFISEVKKKIDEQFTEINYDNLYYVKKGLRKVLRSTNKHIRHMDSKPGEAELLIYFLRKIKEQRIPIHKNKLLVNLYNNTVKKINSVIDKLHEDLQYDLRKELEDLN